MLMDGQRDAPATLAPGMNQYPSYRRLSGSRAGVDGCGKLHLHMDLIPGAFGPYE